MEKLIQNGKKMKREEWKQHGPGTQLRAIIWSLKGHTKDKFNEIFDLHMDEILEISDILYNMKWDEINKKDNK